MSSEITIHRLKTMGSALDAVSRPSGKCTCCPIELNLGDWYYAPEHPSFIYQIPDDGNIALLADPCNSADIYLNETTGVKYHYDATLGMCPIGFSDDHPSFLILGEIIGDIMMTSRSTLIFQGGKIIGSLHGCDTTIDAGPVQIFDVDIALTGTFVNEFAYPEWWGAKSTLDNQSLSNPANCRASIQRALDSLFGEIRFCPGFYYVGNAVQTSDQELALLYLNKTKTIRMSGRGHLASNLQCQRTATVIWTDQDVNLLLINISDSDETLPQFRIATIIGGELNVSGCVNYSHTAILIYPTSLRQFRLNTTVIGPIPIFWRNNSGQIDWPDSVVCPQASDLANGYKGYGIRFSHNPYLLDNAGQLINNKKAGTCYLSEVHSIIYGFGQGFVIEYASNAASMTSLVLGGLIDNCFRYVYAPSRAFNGGVVECVIQTRKFNARDGFAEPVIQGDFTEAYLNPEVWDLPEDIDLFTFTPNSVRMRFGQRILPHMVHHSLAAGMEKYFPDCRYGTVVNPSTNIGEITANSHWEEQVKGLSAILGSDSGAQVGSLGNFDLNSLSAANASSLSPNYVHLLDNDLLSIDQMEGGYSIEISQTGLNQLTVNNNSEPIWRSNTSPFDRDGMIFVFEDNQNMPNAQLIVTINFPFNRHLLQFLAIHLKGATFNHFSSLNVNLRHKVLGDRTETDHESLLFYGSYTDIAQEDSLRDIILPFYFKSNGPHHYPVSLTLTFNGFITSSRFWNSGTHVESFKFSIEGRFHRHYNHQVFTSSGGSLGKDLTRLGKPYLLGTKKYSKFSEFPIDAADGAIGVISCIENNTFTNDYPVVKTPDGWMIQHLVGTTAKLAALASSFEGFSVGQSAFDITLGKPVWWNGNAWIDANGSSH